MSFVVFWFRRDLRLEDNAGLHHALKSGHQVLPVFIFDRDILASLPAADRRVAFIHQAVDKLAAALRKVGSTLLVRHGAPLEVFKELLAQYPLEALYTNHDYEPYAEARDAQIGALLPFHTFKDQCIFERDEILTDAGKPYTVFTPYSKRWKARLTDERAKCFEINAFAGNFAPRELIGEANLPTLPQLGFEEIPHLQIPSPIFGEALIKNYATQRDYPAIHGTSRLSVHLRFGTVSIRQVVRALMHVGKTEDEELKANVDKFLTELIWREFYMMILWNFPHVGEGKNFKPAFDAVQWRQDAGELKAWQEGKTGYPLVDAGMRELNETGYMHNRVRMVTASFLTKHLLHDWREGEAYFAEKLLDFELASNNGNWQWAASVGCDAVPYFRIFNPEAQLTKFDGQKAYIRRWLPEYGSPAYPSPIVAHAQARQRALDAFKGALAAEF